MLVDAHHHLWRLSRGDYAFPARGDAVLYRDFLFGDLEPHLAVAGIGRTVVVQATDTVEETAFLLDLAAATPAIAGVVGWWDPRFLAGLDRLFQLDHAERLVGVRPMLQKHDEIGWLLDAAAVSQLGRIAERGLVFDALVDARHLGAIVDLCRAVPALRVVIDHFGKPWRRPDLWDAWQDGMRRLAAFPNCFVKVSGYPFAAAAATEPWRSDRLLAHVRDLFGSERLIWGSDWPVAEREGGYARVLEGIRGQLAQAEAAAVLGGNAVAVYRLPGRVLG